MLLVAALATLPATAADPDTLEPFVGTWLGTVAAPHARAEIGFAFKRTEKGLLTTFHMPAMFLSAAALGPATVADHVLNVGPLQTRLARDGDRLSGTFGLSHLAIELRRAAAFPAPPVPPPPPPAAPPPAWTAPLGGEIWASPLVHAQTVYVGTARGTFHALDAATGHSRWRWSGPHPIFGTALSTPELVCFLDGRQQLVALRRTDGAPAWTTALHDESLAGAPFKPNETYNQRTATPVLVDDTLIVGSSDGGIYALDPVTGAVRWRHSARTRSFATPGRDPANGELLFAGIDGTLLTFDPRTRREISRLQLPGPLSSTPVLAGDTLLVGCRDYSLYGLRRADLAVNWRFSFWFSWIESTPAVVDGIAYLGGSDFARITALDPARGQAAWSTIVNGLTWGTPLVAGETVFAGTSAQRDALIPHQGGIVALNRRSGAIEWRHPLPLVPGAARAGVLGSLARADDLVIAATFDGTVVALPIGR